MTKKPFPPTLPFNIKSFKSKISIQQTDAITFLKTLQSESIDLIITDPAYSGMNQHLKLGKGRIVGDYRAKGEEGQWFKEFHDTAENYGNFLFEANRVLKNNSHIFLMFDSYSMLTLGPLVRNYFNVKNIIVWDKVNLGMGHYFRRQSEFILFACKGKKPLSRRDIPDIWRIKRIHKPQYPTQKPVELFEAMIASSRNKGEVNFVVCDPFVGSGSSAIAAIKQNCDFLGSDISDEAVLFANQRIQCYMDSQQDIFQTKSSVDSSQQKPFWNENQ